MISHPERIPLFVMKRGDNTIQKQKYLCPKDLTISEFGHVLKKRL